MTGGLVSPPESHYNHSPQLPATSSPSSSALPHQESQKSPWVPVVSSSALSTLPLERSTEVVHAEDTMDSCEDGFGAGSPKKLTEEAVSCVGTVVSQLNLEPRSRQCSLGSSLSSLSETEDANQPETAVQVGVDCEDSDMEDTNQPRTR